MSWRHYFAAQQKAGKDTISGMTQDEDGKWIFVFAKGKRADRCQVVFCNRLRGKGKKTCHCHHQRRWRLNNPEADVVAQVRDRAARTDVECSLTKETLLAACGPDFVANRGVSNNALQLDRIDPARGYVADNIQPLTGLQNRQKSDKSPEDWNQTVDALRDDLDDNNPF